jgi:hypothetical protein
MRNIKCKCLLALYMLHTFRNENRSRYLCSTYGIFKTTPCKPDNQRANASMYLTITQTYISIAVLHSSAEAEYV